MIERVKELRAELQVGPLRELEVLEDRQINVVNSRPADRVTSGIAEGLQWNDTGRSLTRREISYADTVVGRRVEIEMACNTRVSETAAVVECTQGARIERVRFSDQVGPIQATGLQALIVI